MNKPSVFRILLDILILVCVLKGWWFFAAPLGIAGVFYYPYFIEIIISGMIYTALFQAIPGNGVRMYFALIVSIILFFVVAGIKKAIRLRE